MAAHKKPNKTQADYEQLGKMLVSFYETGYFDRKQAYKQMFIKGILAGLGGVIGATLVVALILWILSLFDQVPLIGRLIENLDATIQTQ